jgi:hypothetical protein
MKIFHDNGDRDFNKSIKYLKWLLNNVLKKKNANIKVKAFQIVPYSFFPIEIYLTCEGKNLDDTAILILLSAYPNNERAKNKIINILEKFQKEKA